MAEHDDQADPQRVDAELHRPEDAGVDHMAGRADDEQVTEALVEDDLRRDPRITAAEENGERLLPVADLGPPGGVLPGMQRLAGDESAVAVEEFLPGQVWCGLTASGRSPGRRHRCGGGVVRNALHGRS